MRLVREILNRIAYETDAGGKVITQGAAASSFTLLPSAFVLHPSATWLC